MPTSSTLSTTDKSPSPEKQPSDWRKLLEKRLDTSAKAPVENKVAVGTAAGKASALNPSSRQKSPAPAPDKGNKAATQSSQPSWLASRSQPETKSVQVPPASAPTPARSLSQRVAELAQKSSTSLAALAEKSSLSSPTRTTAAQDKAGQAPSAAASVGKSSTPSSPQRTGENSSLRERLAPSAVSKSPAPRQSSARVSEKSDGRSSSPTRIAKSTAVPDKVGQAVSLKEKLTSSTRSDVNVSKASTPSSPLGQTSARNSTSPARKAVEVQEKTGQTSSLAEKLALRALSVPATATGKSDGQPPARSSTPLQRSTAAQDKAGKTSSLAERLASSAPANATASKNPAASLPPSSLAIVEKSSSQPAGRSSSTGPSDMKEKIRQMMEKSQDSTSKLLQKAPVVPDKGATQSSQQSTSATSKAGDSKALTASSQAIASVGSKPASTPRASSLTQRLASSTASLPQGSTAATAKTDSQPAGRSSTVPIQKRPEATTDTQDSTWRKMMEKRLTTSADKQATALKPPSFQPEGLSASFSSLPKSSSVAPESQSARQASSLADRLTPAAVREANNASKSSTPSPQRSSIAASTKSDSQPAGRSSTVPIQKRPEANADTQDSTLRKMMEKRPTPSAEAQGNAANKATALKPSSLQQGAKSLTERMAERLAASAASDASTTSGKGNTAPIDRPEKGAGPQKDAASGSLKNKLLALSKKESAPPVEEKSEGKISPLKQRILDQLAASKEVTDQGGAKEVLVLR